MGGDSGQNGLYLFDRETGHTKTLAEKDANGGTLIKVAMSDDGRYVGFNKLGAPSIADTQTGVISEVGINGEVCDISGDGQFVAYFAGSLHVRQIATGDEEAINESFCGQLSFDGALVAYIATDPVLGITDGTPQVAVKDLVSGETELISRMSDGSPGDASSSWPSISNDGRYVTFESRAAGLVATDTNNESDVFVWDRQSDTMRLVSSPDQGDFSQTPQISQDGRQVAFLLGRLYVRNLETGALEEVSVNSYGDAANSSVPAVVGAPQAISGDGRYVAFESDATNLASGQLVQYGNIFLHDRQAGFLTPSATPGMLPPTGGAPEESAFPVWLVVAAGMSVTLAACVLANSRRFRRRAR